MDSHYAKEFTHGFIVGESELKKITELLSERIGDFEIRADCADDVARSFKSVKELATFENPSRQRIQRLKLSARSDDFKKRASIDLSGSRRQGISIEIEARDDIVTRLRSDILDVIGGMRPWFDFDAVHRVDLVWILIIALNVLWVGLWTAIAFEWTPTPRTDEIAIRAFGIAQLKSFSAGGVMIAMCLVLHRFRLALFPRAVFLIGQAKSQFVHLERIQWGIIIAFAVSFVAGLVVLVLQVFAAA